MEEQLKEMLNKRPDELEGETLKLFETIIRIIDERDELKSDLKKKDLEITSLKMEHNYDVKMIDEVKCEALKLYKEIDLMAEIIATLAVNSSIIQKQIEEKYCEFANSDEDCCWKTNKKCSDCVKEYIQKQVKEK